MDDWIWNKLNSSKEVLTVVSKNKSKYWEPEATEGAR